MGKKLIKREGKKDKPVKITQRNAVIWDMSIAGYSIDVIASEFKITPSTVRDHIAKVKKTFGVPDIEAMRQEMYKLFPDVKKSLGDLIKAGDSKSINQYLKGLGIYISRIETNKREFRVNIEAVTSAIFGNEPDREIQNAEIIEGINKNNGC